MFTPKIVEFESKVYFISSCQVSGGGPYAPIIHIYDVNTGGLTYVQCLTNGAYWRDMFIVEDVPGMLISGDTVSYDQAISFWIHLDVFHIEDV